MNFTGSLFCFVRKKISANLLRKTERLVLYVDVHVLCMLFYGHVRTSGPQDTQQPVTWILSELLTSPAQVLP